MYAADQLFIIIIHAKTAAVYSTILVHTALFISQIS